MTLTTTRLLALALLTGCFGSTTEETDKSGGNNNDDSGDTTDTSTTDSGTDTSGGGGGGGGADTAMAAQIFVGNITTDGAGTFVSGNLGMAFFGIPAQAMVCDFRGELTLEGAAATAACPECEWSFNLSGITGSVGGGPLAPDGDCEGQFMLAAGSFDTYFDYDWGFAPSFDFYGDGSIIVDETVVLGDGSEWFPFAFNAAAYEITQVYGDSTAADFVRPVLNDAGEQAYAYYYL